MRNKKVAITRNYRAMKIKDYRPQDVAKFITGINWIAIQTGADDQTYEVLREILKPYTAEQLTYLMLQIIEAQQLDAQDDFSTNYPFRDMLEFPNLNICMRKRGVKMELTVNDTILGNRYRDINTGLVYEVRAISPWPNRIFRQVKGRGAYGAEFEVSTEATLEDYRLELIHEETKL